METPPSTEPPGESARGPRTVVAIVHGTAIVHLSRTCSDSFGRLGMLRMLLEAGLKKTLHLVPHMRGHITNAPPGADYRLENAKRQTCFEVAGMLPGPNHRSADARCQHLHSPDHTSDTQGGLQQKVGNQGSGNADAGRFSEGDARQCTHPCIGAGAARARVARAASDTQVLSNSS